MSGLPLVFVVLVFVNLKRDLCLRLSDQQCTYLGDITVISRRGDVNIVIGCDKYNHRPDCIGEISNKL